jgi:hypothetical protein
LMEKSLSIVSTDDHVALLWSKRLEHEASLHFVLMTSLCSEGFEIACLSFSLFGKCWVLCTWGLEFRFSLNGQDIGLLIGVSDHSLGGGLSLVDNFDYFSLNLTLHHILLSVDLSD